MELKIIFGQTKEYLKGKLVSLILITIVIGGLSLLIDMLLNASAYSTTVSVFTQQVQRGSQMRAAEIVDVITEGTSKFNIMKFISLTITSILSSGLSLELLQSVRLDQKVKISGVFQKVRDNFTTILVVSTAVSAITWLLDLIPIVGPILSIIATYALSFSVYLIIDTKDKRFDYFIKESYDLTNGNKFELFLINLYYSLVPLIALPVIFVGYLIIFTKLYVVGYALVIIGIIMLSVLGIKYIPYMMVARAKAYDTLFYGKYFLKHASESGSLD